MIVISFVSPFRAFIIHNNIRATTDNHFPHRSIKSNEKKVFMTKTREAAWYA